MNNYKQEQLAFSATLAQREPARRLISRRSVLRGLAGFTGLATLGGAFAFWRYRQSQIPVYVYRAGSEVINAVAWSPDGKRITSGSSVYTQIAKDNFSLSWTIRIWDALTGHHMAHYSGMPYGINALAWSPNSQFIAAESGPFDTYVVRVLNATSGAALLTYPKHTWQDLNGFQFHQQAVAWSPDGKRIASGSEDKSVQVWNAETGAWTFSYFGHSNIITSVAWSPDSRYIVSGSADGTVQVWLP